MATEQQVPAWGLVMLPAVNIFATVADMVIAVDARKLTRRRAGPFSALPACRPT